MGVGVVASRDYILAPRSHVTLDAHCLLLDRAFPNIEYYQVLYNGD